MDLVCIVISVAWNIASIANYLIRPRYTLLNASLRIKHLIVEQQKTQPDTNSLLIGRGANQISLLSGGIPSLDSDGAMPLAQKLDVYHPGWFMNWTDDSPLRPATVAEKRRMVQRAAFPELDPYNGAGIVLYRLFPIGDK